MTGRKNPDLTEEEKEREYRLSQKRGSGERIVGEGGESLEHQGPAAEVAHERARWEKEREAKRTGPDASRGDDTTMGRGGTNEAT